MVTKVVIVHGGELAKDVAEQIVTKKPASMGDSQVSLRCASERPKTLLDLNSDTIVCFILQTIENGAPTEEGGSCVRFFKRKTHPETLLKEGTFSFAVLGVGDSNLLLDRQTTSAKDCNQVAMEFDARLAALSGQRFYELGMADERTGLQEVEPWIDGLWNAIQSNN
uniref:Flavodoxin-like domain-containing protein n=1 Tax=Helicotheca tamesis TaxID=374047 RepID=A0A7S2HJ27_9STRA|mmetsp:Transcript_18590/g.25590  ORF Transcript_18590/g.25590 Transcript_18590/m.25590 type:complete len:167 (+) Transcript_18590:88-588(+)